MTLNNGLLTMDLLPPALVRKLQALNLGSRSRRAGKLRGDRRSTKRGSSVEFADYRNYVPGDDLRRLDWNLYARTDRLFLKIYEEEEDRAVHLLVDATASMGFGSPSKHEVAQRLAAALGYVALHELDRLHMTHLAEDSLNSMRPLRGAASTATMLEFLGGIALGGQGNLNRSLSEYAGRAAAPGILVLISDLLDPDGIRQGLRTLGGRGHEIIVLHLISHEELTPSLEGDLELVDAESGDRRPMTLDRTALEAYDRRLNAWLNELRHECSAVGATYSLIRAENPVEDVLFGQLRQAGVLVS